MYIKSEIEKNLIDKNIRLEILEETTSTNDYIKKFSNLDSAVVIAKKQTLGRGRLNRAFYSPENKGIYLSILVKPQLETKDSVKITTFTAVAVANAIEKVSGLKTQIKWVNDIFIGGKKVCGILAEASQNFKEGKLNYAVIGIGINLYGKDFPSDIKNIATSIELESGKKIDANLLVVEIINSLYKINDDISGDYLTKYKEKCFILNREIIVDTGKEKYKATALNVLDNGALLVEKEGKTFELDFGDVSVRI